MAGWPGRPGDLTMPKPSLTDRVYDDLKRRILADPPEWGPGERLPRIRELVEHYGALYGASEQPITTALQFLRREGLIVGRQGSGMFMPGEPEPDQE